AESVAEGAVLLMLGIARHCQTYTGRIEARRWNWVSPVGRALCGRTAGIVGVGQIGSALARRLKAFEMRVLGIKRSPDPQLQAGLGLDWLGTPAQLPDLMAESDFIIVCADLNPSSAGLIGPRALEAVKPGAFLVNVARGA